MKQRSAAARKRKEAQAAARAARPAKHRRAANESPLPESLAPATPQPGHAALPAHPDSCILPAAVASASAAVPTEQKVECQPGAPRRMVGARRRPAGLGRLPAISANAAPSFAAEQGGDASEGVPPAAAHEADGPHIAAELEIGETGAEGPRTGRRGMQRPQQGAAAATHAGVKVEDTHDADSEAAGGTEVGHAMDLAELLPAEVGRLKEAWTVSGGGCMSRCNECMVYSILSQFEAI